VRACIAPGWNWSDEEQAIFLKTDVDPRRAGSSI
jgi:hypothetical protein